MIFTEGENMVISINDASEIPIYQQIRNQIVLGISDGRLAPGEQLPTVRALAEEIGISEASLMEITMFSPSVNIIQYFVLVTIIQTIQNVK